MRKILLLSLLSILAFAACKNEPHYQINGTVTGDLEGKTVYLRKVDNMRPGDIIDSTVVEKGEFKLKGSVATPDLYNISVSGARIFVGIFLENAPIKVSIDADQAQNSIATGSHLNDLYANYTNEIRNNYHSKLQAVMTRGQEAEQKDELTPELEEELKKEYDDLFEGYKTYQLNFLNDNPNTIVSAVILRSLVNILTPEEIEGVLSKFDTIIGKTPYISSIKEELPKLKRVSIGSTFIEIKSLTPNGKEIALSDYAGKGKYVLIDFWASWCGPCRKVNPQIVELYNKYKKKDFEIVGVSLDRTREDWVKGIKDDGITWPQMSDLQYWQSECVQLYNIQSIPATILLDKNGVIIANNLHPEQLRAKLAELLD